MTADIEYSVPIVIFRFFPKLEAELVKKSQESPIIPCIQKAAETIETLVNGIDYEIDPDCILDKQIELSNQFIDDAVKELNSDNINNCVAKYWYDNEIISVLCIDNKCWIERGEILDVEDDMLKNTVQHVYTNANKSAIRVLIFFVNVFDQRVHNHIVLYPDYDDDDE